MLSNTVIQKNISESIKTELKRRDWSIYKLQKETNIPKSSLYFMMDNTNDWSLEYLMRISKVLGLSIENLIFQSENSINKELVAKCEELTEEVTLLRERVATYETVINYDALVKVKKRK